MHSVEEVVEFTAVAAGAVSGALHAQRRGFDFVGVVVVGIATGLGGGLIRDALLNNGPALALQQPVMLIVVVVAALVSALFGTFTHHLAGPLWFADTLSLGLFAVAGLQRAEAAGLALAPSLFLGVVNCVGGGLTRDVLCRETPVLLLPGQPYAVTALLAGAVYLSALRGYDAGPRTAELFAVGTAVALRVLAAWRGWNVPTPPDLPSSVRRRFGAGRDASNDTRGDRPSGD